MEGSGELAVSETRGHPDLSFFALPIFCLNTTPVYDKKVGVQGFSRVFNGFWLLAYNVFTVREPRARPLSLNPEPVEGCRSVSRGCRRLSCVCAVVQTVLLSDVPQIDLQFLARIYPGQNLALQVV